MTISPVTSAVRFGQVRVEWSSLKPLLGEASQVVFRNALQGTPLGSEASLKTPGKPDALTFRDSLKALDMAGVDMVVRGVSGQNRIEATFADQFGNPVFQTGLNTGPLIPDDVHTWQELNKWPAMAVQGAFIALTQQWTKFHRAHSIQPPREMDQRSWFEAPEWKNRDQLVLHVNQIL